MNKLIVLLGLLLVLIGFTLRGNTMQAPEEHSIKFDEFIAKKKFTKDGFYPGIAHESMRPLLTKKINQIAKDFEAVANSDNPTDRAYQQKIGIGLARFDDVYIDLDTEDRDRVCEHIEQIMDIVGLESSDGQLNMWLYGFDPTTFNK